MLFWTLVAIALLLVPRRLISLVGWTTRWLTWNRAVLVTAGVGAIAALGLGESPVDHRPPVRVWVQAQAPQLTDEGPEQPGIGRNRWMSAEAVTWLQRRIGGQQEVTFPTPRGLRRVDLLVGRTGHEVKVGTQALSDSTEEQIAKDVLLLQGGELRAVVWHFFPNPDLDEHVVSEALVRALASAGFGIEIHRSEWYAGSPVERDDDGYEDGATCCRVCTSGCACGNACISCDEECHQPSGCACDG